MAEYHGRLRLYHQDLYRLGGTAEALAGGLLDERQVDGVTLSEWADRLDGDLMRRPTWRWSR
jgi:tRNA A37 threonylcarbamoyladenosine biosynthesis protein TsaE